MDHILWTGRICWARLSILVLGYLFVASASAGTTQYFYDDLGRVVQAIGSDGSVRQYQYDQNGNVTAINKVGGGALIISGLSPSIGHVTANVTISGSGFNAIPSQNDVRFGSIPATVTAASATRLTVIVPEGAVTGPVSVTTGGNTVMSATSYVVRMPAITSFSPQFVSPGAAITVLGANLNLIPGASAFSVNGASAAVSSIINAKAVITAPASTGHIAVDTPYGDTSSAARLVVLPAAVSMANVLSYEDLVLGAPAHSINITQPNRYAVFRLDAQVGQLYALQLSSLAVTPGAGRAAISVYSPNGSLFTSANVLSNTNLVYLPQIPATGTYLIAMSLAAATTSAAFNFVLALDPQISPNGVSFPVATTVTNEIRRFAFHANAGDDLGLALTSIVAPYAVTVAVKKLDGMPAVSSPNCSPSTTPGCALQLRDLPYTGYYSIEILQSGNLGWAVSGTLTFSTAVAATLTPNTPIGVSLSVPGQYALLAFTATQGQNVSVNQRSVAVTPSNKALAMTVLNTAVTPVNDNSTLNFPNIGAGTYTVLLTPFFAATATAEIEFAAKLSTVVAPNGTTTNFATTLAGQHEYFTFEGVAGQNLGLALTSMVKTPSTGSIAVYIDRPNNTELMSNLCGLNMQPGCQFEMRNLPVTGTYKMRVMTTDHSKMSFGLTMSEHISGALALNTPLSVNIASPGRYALLTFTASAGQTVALNVGSFTTNPVSRHLNMVVYGPDNNRLDNPVTSNTNLTLNLQNLAAGTHKVLVHGVSGVTAAMQVTLASGVTAALPVDGVSRSFATTVKAQLGYFTFNATAGQNVGLGLTNLVITPNTTIISLEIKTPSGGILPGLVCNPATKPGCQLNLSNLPLTGTYKITAAPYHGPEYQLSFTLTLSQHIGGTLALDTPHALSLVPGQYALLTFAAAAGQTVAINASSFATTPAGKAVAISVTNSSGASVDGGSSSNAVNPIVNLPNLAAGTYSVLVHTVDAATASIQVTLAGGLAADLPLDAVSRSFAGTVRDQNGYFTFNATAGQTVGIAITNLTLSPAATYLVVEVTRPDNSPQVTIDCRLTAQPGCQSIILSMPTTGTYRIRGRPNDNNGVMIGYTLTLSQPLEATLSAASPYNLTLSSPGRSTRLSFTLTTTQTVILQATSIATTPANKSIQLRAFSPAGASIGETSSSTNPKLTLTNLAAGTYSLLVNTEQASTATAQVTMQ